MLLSFLYLFLIGLVCGGCPCLVLIMLVVDCCLLWFGWLVVYSWLFVWLELWVGLLCCFWHVGWFWVCWFMLVGLYWLLRWFVLGGLLVWVGVVVYVIFALCLFIDCCAGACSC